MPGPVRRERCHPAGSPAAAAAFGFAAVVEQSPGFAEAHFNLGLVRQEQGRYEEAIASFHKALALKPHLHGANLFLGISEFRVNRLEAASAAIRKEIISHPRDANAWMWLGVVSLAQDHPEQAVEALDKADKLKPGDPAAMQVERNGRLTYLTFEME